MKNLVVHLGLQPGELLLQSQTAKDKGVVIVPPSAHATRFSVEQMAGPTFSLLRVTTHAWPQPAQREALFTFESQVQAQEALEELEAALMLHEEPAVEEAPVLPSVTHEAPKLTLPWAGMVACGAVGGAVALLLLKSFF